MYHVYLIVYHQTQDAFINSSNLEPSKPGLENITNLLRNL